MIRKMLSLLCVICIFFVLPKCESQKINAVQIVFFDNNNFDQTDTLFIDNTDTVNRIKNLFKNMNETDAKFPRKYQIALLGKSVSEIYNSNGKYVRYNKKTYVLPKSEDFNFLESLLNSHVKGKEIPIL